MNTAYFRSALGWLKISGDSKGMTSLTFLDSKPKKTISTSPSLKKYIKALQSYFKSAKQKQIVPFNPSGTEFQKKVWKKLSQIPWGKTVSYQWVAQQLGRPKAVRAVASAIGQNRISIFIPCHRVVGKNGSLTGYAWGLKRKSWLLHHESSNQKGI